MKTAARLVAFLAVPVVVLGLSKLHASVWADPPYDFTRSMAFTWTPALIALLAIAAYGAGLPDRTRTFGNALALSLAASASAALGISVLQLLLGSQLLARFVVFGSALVLVPVWVGCAAVCRRADDRASGRDRVVAVGEVDELGFLVSDIDTEPERWSRLVATLSPAEASETPGALVARFDDVRGSVLVLSSSAQLDERIVTQAAGLHERGVRVRTVVSFYDEWLGKLPLSELERASLLFDIGEIHQARYGRLKRIFDLALALAGLPLLVVVVPFVAVGDLLANRGPLLYSQDRVGRAERTFRIRKFRTMVAGDTASTWTDRDDPRITSFGKVLRRTHLDELPQLWNVLRGDLSIVGPRPEQPHYVAELEKKLPYYRLRHLVRPGITGWAQVKYPYAASEEDAREKLQYEFWYLQHQSLGLDARIVLRTLRSVVGRQGR